MIDKKNQISFVNMFEYNDCVPLKSSSVSEISLQTSKKFCSKYHYAGKRFPTGAMFNYGIYRGGVLKGVCVLGAPASPFVSVSATGEKNMVIELQRLALSENIKNEGTFFLSRVWRMLEKKYKGIVVSYADTAHNHHGGVYQAFGFYYAGCSSPRTDIFSESGHSRHHCGDINKRINRTPKHRYWLSCPRGKFDKLSKWGAMGYPKPDVAEVLR